MFYVIHEAILLIVKRTIKIRYFLVTLKNSNYLGAGMTYWTQGLKFDTNMSTWHTQLNVSPLVPCVLQEYSDLDTAPLAGGRNRLRPSLTDMNMAVAQRYSDEVNLVSDTK